MRTGMAVFVFGMVAAHAGQAQMAVFDGAVLAQQIQSVLTEAQQLEQQAQQYQQLVQNARALANLDSLLAEFQISPGELNATELRQLLNDVYGLSADDPAFAENARTLLGLQYGLPMRSAAAQEAFADLDLSSDAAATLANTYNTGNRDLGQAIQYADVVAATNAARSRSAEATRQQIDQAMALTDNSEGATLHMILAGQLNGQRQADTALQLQALQADKLVQDQLRQVERDNAVRQQALDAQQGTRAFIAGSIPALSASSISFR
ncbi:MAG: hypothetical protein ACM31D_09220 [Bacteroidota bacterium]